MFKHTFVRYLAVALAAYVIDMGGYVVLLGVGLLPAMANLLVKIAAALFAFYAHRFFTYRITGKGEILQHALRYFSLVLVYGPTSSLCLVWLMRIIHQPILAKFICDVVLFVVVYWITTHLTFLKTER